MHEPMNVKFRRKTLMDLQNIKLHYITEWVRKCVLKVRSLRKEQTKSDLKKLNISKCCLDPDIKQQQTPLLQNYNHHLEC